MSLIDYFKMTFDVNRVVTLIDFPKEVQGNMKCVVFSWGVYKVLVSTVALINHK